jgi:hypothetical protein
MTTAQNNVWQGQYPAPVDYLDWNQLTRHRYHLRLRHGR